MLRKTLGARLLDSLRAVASMRPQRNAAENRLTPVDKAPVRMLQ